MKANFALSLSFDGVILLHRAAGGWRRVGSLAVDAPDLPKEMGDLRAKAKALEPDGIASKLIIPEDQIKYLTLDTGEVDAQMRQAAARAALDGATPYAVENLAFDVTPDGPKTHIAAVAHETLAEAEEFAVQFGFNPLFSVAIPGDAPFLGEPFFGPTAHAAQVLEAGDRVEPDGIAVVEIADIAITQGDLDEVEAAPDTSTEPKDDPEAEQAAEETASEDEDVPELRRRITLQTTKSDTVQEPEEPATPAAPSMPGFSSRRTPASASEQDAVETPALGGVTRREDAPPAPSNVQIVTASIPEIKGAPAPTPPLSVPPAPRAQDDRSPDLTTPVAAAASLQKRASIAGAPSPTPEEAKAAQASEQQRLTVFGARKSVTNEAPVIGGKPRYLGVLLTAALLIFLAAVATWAALFTEDGIARWFGATPETDVLETAEQDHEPEPEPEGPTTAALDVAPFLEGAPPPRVLQPEPTPVKPALNADNAQEFYAVSGIWTVPSQVPGPPRFVPLDDLYHSSLTPAIPSLDAVALPRLPDYSEQDVLPRQVSPAPRGTKFQYDARGLIIPTPEGALSPGGFTVFQGRPPAVPPLRPEAPPQDETTLPPVIDQALAAARPQTRPDALIENAERRNLGGLSRSELARLNPRTRPDTGKAADEVDETPTENATAQSLRPNTRPKNFATIVARAQEQRRNVPAPEIAAAPPVSVSPALPSRASVTRQATLENALNLRRINLMGVYGKPSDRSALVRLSNGRYRKVQVGDRLDGGRVSAIGDTELRYQKNGRNISLKMPRS